MLFSTIPVLSVARYLTPATTSSVITQCRLFSTTSTSKSRRRSGGRHFAYRKNELIRQVEAKKEKKRKKALGLSTPPPPPRGVPPALLAPTGSPHVYVARMAVMDDENDTDPQEALQYIQSLFRNYQTLPRIYETHQFEYVSPQVLNFEYPQLGRSEVAFLGRSNVGKSSLVNALMRRNLCQTSKSPGRTQLPYYYGLFPKQSLDHPSSVETKLQPATAMGFLVDLPGYGYGAAPKQVVEEWQAKTQDWLLDRRDAGALKRLFLLLDARREISKLDETVIQWTEEAEIPFTLVITKADRVGIPTVIKQTNDFCIRYATKKETFQSPIVHVASSSNRWGIHELLETVETEFIGLPGDEEIEENI